MYKGIFWFINEDGPKLLSIKVLCDETGKPLEDVNFSSKSGENFNHKLEWDTLPDSVKNSKSFDYYPRGRVEIKNSKIRIFANPVLLTEKNKELIITEFGLVEVLDRVQIIADNSSHYSYKVDS